MKKKLAVLLSLMLLCLNLTAPALAVDLETADSFSLVNDWADLLTDDEEALLLDELSEISERQEVELAVTTADDLGGYSSVADYAEAIFLAGGYGYGADQDGILLFINMGDREWYIATHGFGMIALTDDDVQEIGNEMQSDLAGGEYASAFRTYGQCCDALISRAYMPDPSGSDFDGDAYVYDTEFTESNPLSLTWILVSLGIGLLIAIVVVLAMVKKLKTVNAQVDADRYLRQDSLNITDQRDIFLYHTLNRTAKPQNQNHSSGGSSGRSSGSSFGGGGGKF